MAGRQFGRLTVSSFDSVVNRSAQWLCRCSCGKEKVFDGGLLRRGLRNSCGCLRYDSPNKLRHGNAVRGRLTSEYQAWVNMRSRCRSPSNPLWKYYGGRGIAVCKRWESFASFLADMGPKPTTLHTLERKNVHKGYCPANCEWATRKTQARNHRRSVTLTFNGQTQHIADWAEQLGLSVRCLKARKTRGWSDVKILTTPVKLKTDVDGRTR